ncbi:hypothetical protein FUAX_17680 [Fulvitalea axinellae]|uniref:DUF4838 domain-containing protein n=1 Tax=Fulvitalea axinellae TaxID=1182444 RepID=A0AAU9CAZ1_9BACT|nr:hypothetical protein FUAX_17680 [Fulvitalea axinellae]
MKKIFSILIPLLFFGLHHCYSKNGIKPGSIKTITRNTDNQTVVFAEQEFRKYWKKMTGNDLKASGKNSNGIRVSLTLSSDFPGLKWDGYNITVNKKGISISAKEARGVLFGVYAFLEKQGCSFFYPDPDLEVIPEIKNQKISHVNFTENPRIEWRGMALYGVRDDQIKITGRVIDWMAKQRYNYALLSQDRPAPGAGLAQEVFFKGKTEEILLPELIKRDFLINMGEHNTHCYLDKDKLFKEHPDWFAEINGKRTKGQICYGNDKAMNYYSEQLIKWLKDKPWVDFIGTWPLDGGGYCQCIKCKKKRVIADAISLLAENIRKTNRNVTVEFLSYKPATFELPNRQIPKNFAVLYCPDLGNKPDLEKDWTKATENAQGVYQFEYYMADHWRARGNVWLRPEFAVQSADYLAENNFRGTVSLYLPIQTWWRGSFNYFFFGKALWEKDLSVNRKLTEHCEKHYGKYAKEVLAIYNELLYEVQEGGYFAVDDKNTEEVVRKSKRIVQRSEELLDKIYALRKNIKNKTIGGKIEKLWNYVEGTKLFFSYIAFRTPKDKIRLLNFAEEHEKAEDGASVQRQYLNWRLQWIPKIKPQYQKQSVGTQTLPSAHSNTLTFDATGKIDSNGSWNIFLLSKDKEPISVSKIELVEDGRVVISETPNKSQVAIKISKFFDMGKYEIRLTANGKKGQKVECFVLKNPAQ